MKSLPEFDFAPVPEMEPVAFGRGWWRYSEARTAEREERYRESARGLGRVAQIVQNVARRVVYGRRCWKPARISAKTYMVEDSA